MIINIILIFIGVLAYYKGYYEGYKKAKFDLGCSTNKPKDMNYGKNR